MARYTGKALRVRFTPDGGPVVDISADERTLEIRRKVASADATAGQDDYANTLPTFASATANYTAVDNTTNGTAVYEGIKDGVSGTLEWSPRGTTPGMPKRTAPAFIDTSDETYPYNNVVALTIGFQLTAREVKSTW